MPIKIRQREYDELKKRYEPAARNLEEYLRKLLKEAKIQALFSKRVKELDSLYDKLDRLEKEEHKNFSSLDDVVKGIKDLAGVRVAVYFPSDKWEVEALLYEFFRDLTQTTHPTPEEKSMISSAQRFEGYSAEHYNIPIQKEGKLDDERFLLPKGSVSELKRLHREKLQTPPSDVNPEDWKSISVELQVASLPIHTWAEPEHSFVYKREETTDWKRESRTRALLDTLNGHAIASEVVLEMLKWELIERYPFNTRPAYKTFKGDLNWIFNRISETKCSCLFIGQNNYGLFYNNNRNKRKKAQRIISQASCKIQFVIADLNDKAVRSDVMYSWGPQFEVDWNESVKTLRGLCKANERLQACVSSQVTRETLAFFDPECSEGELILLRSLPHTTPGRRPRTRIRRDVHPARFQQLWEGRPSPCGLKPLPEVVTLGH